MSWPHRPTHWKERGEYLALKQFEHIIQFDLLKRFDMDNLNHLFVVLCENEVLEMEFASRSRYYHQSYKQLHHRGFLFAH